jgi:hypothetical protein
MSNGPRSKAVRVEAAIATPRDAMGCVESAISVTPGSGSDKIADKKEVDQASTVVTKRECTKVAFVPDECHLRLD